MITGHTRFMAGIFLQIYLAHFPRPTHARTRPHKAPPTQSPTHTKPRPHKLHPHQAHPGSESFHNFLTLINAPMPPPPAGAWRHQGKHTLMTRPRKVLSSSRTAAWTELFEANSIYA